MTVPSKTAQAIQFPTTNLRRHKHIAPGGQRVVLSKSELLTDHPHASFLLIKYNIACFL